MKNDTEIPFIYIIKALLHGSGFQNGKKRIYEMFQTLPRKERVDMIKKEYGTGGWRSPLNGDGLHGADYSPKGMSLQWKHSTTKYECHFSWTEIEKYLNILISNEDYYHPIVTTDAEVWKKILKN